MMSLLWVFLLARGIAFWVLCYERDVVLGFISGLVMKVWDEWVA